MAYKNRKRKQQQIEVPIRFLQIKTGRTRVAHDLIQEMTVGNNIDLVIISEPIKRLTKKNKWISDEQMDTAIIIRKKTIKSKQVARERGLYG